MDHTLTIHSRKNPQKQRKTMKTQHKTIIITTILLFIIILNLYIFRQQIKQYTYGMLTNSYFTIDELCASETAKKNNIDNSPAPAISDNLQALIDNVLDPAREEFGSTVWVNSGYRSKQLNRLVGGTNNSQHTTGQAADITTKTKEGNQKLFTILIQQNNYDQIIWEGGGSWIHVSYNPNGQNRKQILAQNNNGTYTNIKTNWQTHIA